ncbi:hypothetical protein GCM10022240_28530 [Microbacterium kribbense]|uniref:Cell division protein FtsL n=1 Tax=Microbacterium kribbense TaxID=433645 RepID=A0ABP7GT06_9MICO
MSSVATARSLPVPAGRPDQRRARRLRALDAPARRRKPRLAYGVVAVLGALSIVGAQMAISVMSTQSSYELAALTTQQRQLTWQKQILHDEVAGLGSPQYLAANASALGMVINQSPSYLRLSDGKILGASKASGYYSSVDPLHRGAVANKLIATTPLVTDPAATIEGSAAKTTSALKNVTPVPVTDGLPTVRTH